MLISLILGALASLRMALVVGADIGKQWHEGFWMRVLNIAATVGWAITVINLTVAAYKLAVA